MDDSDRAVTTKSVIPAKAGIQPGIAGVIIATGLLVLMGTGCTESPDSRVQEVLDTPSTNSSDALVNGRIHGEGTHRCFDEIRDISVFQKDLDAFYREAYPAEEFPSGNKIPSGFIPALEQELKNGWSPAFICVDLAIDTSSPSQAIFTLQRDDEVKVGYAGLLSTKEYDEEDGMWAGIKPAIKISSPIPIVRGATLADPKTFQDSTMSVRDGVNATAITINANERTITYYPELDLLK